MAKETKKQGGGLLGGLFLLVIGIGILWSNEGRTVKTQGAINEATKAYIQVKSDKVDSKNDGKLVATKGKVTVSEDTNLKDSKFGIAVNAIKMKRTVEMYQWKESCETDDNDKKTCTYEKVWDASLLDSSEYTESGHSNPTSKPYDDESYVADTVKLGAFTLPEELVKQLSYDKKKNNDELTAEYNNSIEGLIVSEKYLTNVKEDTPQIGDVRISFDYTTSKSASVLAVQTDDTFEAFTSKKGKDIYTIVEGNKTGAQILESKKEANKTIKWFLRVVGTLLVIGGFKAMFDLVTSILSKVPVLGNIANGAASIVSTILGLGLSLIIIAIAWFRFRPILSIVLVAVVIALVVFLKMYLPKKENEK